jgi:hypothetical protein
MDRKKAEEIRREMEGLFREWRGSGETGRSFAERKGITSSKFLYWKKRLGTSSAAQGRKRSSGNGRGFVPVQVQVVDNGEWSVSQGGVAIEVVLECGDRIRFTEGAGEEMLRRAIRLLREPC